MTVAGEMKDLVYPLTYFDEIFKPIGISIGWIVEGRADMKRITAALDRIIVKWPLLSARLEQDSNRHLYLRVPVNGYPAGYQPYVATTSTCSKKLTHYVPLPLPVAHDMLPVSLMKDSSAPQMTRDWVNRKLPLTYWHITYFPKEDNGDEYSVIGVTFSHAVLDGLGIARVIHALEAELLGKPWEATGLPIDKDGKNKLDVLLRNVMKEQDTGLRRPAQETFGGLIAGIRFALAFFGWHLWQYMWHKTQCRTVVIPEKAYMRLTADIRNELAASGNEKARVSTSDALSSFVFKTVCADANPKNLLQLMSYASMRRFSPPADSPDSIADYPHNCVYGLPYPLFNSALLASLPLPDIAARLADHKHGFTIEDAADVYRLMESAANKKLSAFAQVDPRASETLMLSNVTIARIVDIDWTGAGAGVGKTVCRYKAALTGLPLWYANVVTIAGKMPDGSLLLDLCLSKRRMDMFVGAVERLIQYSEN